MAKEKEQSAAEASQPAASAKELSAAVAPAAPKLPSCHEIVAAIKAAGQSLSQPDREDIIRTVALLPAPASESKPSPYDGLTAFNFRVTYRDLAVEVVARSDREAWAMACDTWHQWPGPKLGKVECLGTVANAA